MTYGKQANILGMSRWARPGAHASRMIGSLNKTQMDSKLRAYLRGWLHKPTAPSGVNMLGQSAAKARRHLPGVSRVGAVSPTSYATPGVYAA